MKERPFNARAHEVRAILAGRMSQFRRIVKEQPSDHHWKYFPEYTLTTNVLSCANNGGTVFVTWTHRIASNYQVDDARPLSPFGEVGDRLYLKEAFRESGNCQQLDGKMPSEDDVRLFDGRIIYAIDDPGNGPWRPSTHMPRWASRILLEVVSVRVERMQEISEADAKAEGTILDCAYRYLFDSINGPGAWDANPFVWAVTFKTVEGGR